MDLAMERGRTNLFLLDELVRSRKRKLTLMYATALLVVEEILDEEYPFQTKRARQPIIPRARYSFANSAQDPKELFRFTEQEIHHIANVMREPH